MKPRGDQPPERMHRQLASVVNRVDPNLPMYFVETPATALKGLMATNRLIGEMFLIFGVVAVLLAAVGLYGVMSFSVNQRTQEFGVRLALGANNGNILAMVLRQGAWQLGIGLALGMAVTLTIAILAGDGLAGALVGISPRDPLTYLAVCALLSMVAAIACYLPAKRATHVDPMIALRAE